MPRYKFNLKIICNLLIQYICGAPAWEKLLYLWCHYTFPHFSIGSYQDTTAVCLFYLLPQPLLTWAVALLQSPRHVLWMILYRCENKIQMRPPETHINAYLAYITSERTQNVWYEKKGLHISSAPTWVQKHFPVAFCRTSQKMHLSN